MASSATVSHGFAAVKRAGGRPAILPDRIDTPNQVFEPPLRQSGSSAARLIILQITDVYTLENIASFKTLVEETKANNPDATVVSMLTGDFLSPYLLSSVDRGAGMMHALGRMGLDYITWGNHEADIDHNYVCRHVRNFPGKWINSNMLDHDAMDAQQEYDVIDLKSPDGKNNRKVGLCAVLSDDPALYSHFKSPGAFGGATITDPWNALTKYKTLLEEDLECDLVIPLQHLYVNDDMKTCKEFDFPVILSGHDHHKVKQVIDGSCLIKPGMNGDYATVLEIEWDDFEVKDPTKIAATFVKVDAWEPDPVLQEENERAYDALIPLRNTELASVPDFFEPLTSNNSRGSTCTMGKYICTLLKNAMNISRRQIQSSVDAVLLMGGNIRGNADYPEGSFFSMEALEAEVKSNEVVGVVPMPGWLLSAGVQATHSGDPIPGWMQYDDGIRQDETGAVTHVNGERLEKNRIYRVATKISDLTNGQSPPWTEYYAQNVAALPPKGAYSNIHAELMSFFARNIWRKLWDAISEEIDDDNCSIGGTNLNDCESEKLVQAMDTSGNGVVSVEDIHRLLKDKLCLSVDEREMTLAQYVHSFADTNGDGTVTKTDFELFILDMEQNYDEEEKIWRLPFPRPPIEIAETVFKADAPSVLSLAV